MSKCAIKGCNSKVDRDSYYHSYYFPKLSKSPERYASWCKLTEKKRSTSKNAKVCARHFKQSDFDESVLLKIRLMPELYKNKTPKLKEGVVPSLHLDDEYNEKEEDDRPLPLTQFQIINVQDILDDVPSKSCANDLDNSKTSASWTYAASEPNIDDREYDVKEMAIQCEFGTEMYRKSNAGNKLVDK